MIRVQQGAAHLAGGCGQEGDQEKPDAESVGAGEGMVTQTDEPTQSICQILTTRSR